MAGSKRRALASLRMWLLWFTLASERGWSSLSPATRAHNAFIYVCHQCEQPTFFDEAGKQMPGAAFGDAVSDVPDKSIEDLYNEARAATSASAYTAAVLCCRKLLMHVAVAKGAKPGATFVEYVQYLADKNYIPPDARDWVDHIRTKGNEANHEIKIMSRVEAEELISFAEMLLKLIFQFPAAVKRRTAGP